MSQQSIQVICIVGEHRSGTTIIDRVLGSLDGVQSLCELDYFWVAGLKNNHRCSCGEHFRDCQFWKGVVAEMFTGSEDLNEISALRGKVSPSRHFPKLYANLIGPKYRRDLDAYRSVIGKLYKALARQTGQRVFVDSSKGPNVPLILAGIPGLEVHVLHVVRDVRGVVYSGKKGNKHPAFNGRMAVGSTASIATGWLVRNIFCGLLKYRFPYQRVIYDELMDNPATDFTALASRLQPLHGKTPRITAEGAIELPHIHTIGGNPHRFKSGATSLRGDNTWREKLPARERLGATLIGAPLLLKYGLL